MVTEAQSASPNKHNSGLMSISASNLNYISQLVESVALLLVSPVGNTRPRPLRVIDSRTVQSRARSNLLHLKVNENSHDARPSAFNNAHAHITFLADSSSGVLLSNDEPGETKSQKRTRRFERLLKMCLLLQWASVSSQRPLEATRGTAALNEEQRLNCTFPSLVLLCIMLWQDCMQKQ